MKQDTEVLDEVVVTALGIERSDKALSYNVQQIKSEDITGIKDANFINSLNGKIAGVSINKSGSGVGGATRVVMRGAKSIEGDNNALYVVDGIPLFNTNMETQIVVSWVKAKPERKVLLISIRKISRVSLF